MNYISTIQAGKKWGISSTRVLVLAKSGRINGAVQIGYSWLIPENAQKPIDARTKVAKTKQTNYEEPFFRYPCFEGRDINSFNPPLSNNEIKMKNICELFHECEFEKANKQLESIAKGKLNKYERIYVYRMSCMINIYTNKVKDFYDSFNNLINELNDDFPKKLEMSYYVHEIEATIGLAKYFVDEFEVERAYQYDESFQTHLFVLCMISLSNSRKDDLNEKDLMAYECMCSLMDNNEYYVDNQSMHTYLGIEYGKILELDKMKYHYQKAIDLAYKHRLYYQLAMLYYYYGRSFNSILDEYPEDFVNRIKSLSNIIHTRYLKFIKSSKIDIFYDKLNSKEFIYVYFAVQGYSNKEVAHLLSISESNVGNKYSYIYQKLCVSNKKELVNYYRNSIANSMNKYLKENG